MKVDLRALLADWPFDTEEPRNNVRLIEGSDARTLIQVREPLGLQQLEYDGRPDGARPQGHATLLEWFQVRATREADFALAPEDCLALMHEGILYYQRYLILFQIEDWRGVVRDTRRNLEYFDFTRLHAEDPGDIETIEQYRPYLLRMNAVARAQILGLAGRREAAAECLREAIATLEGLDPIESPVFQAERTRALKHLTGQIEEFEGPRPAARVDRLRRECEGAVRAEDFHRAVRLRDEIRAIEAEFVL